MKLFLLTTTLNMIFLVTGIVLDTQGVTISGVGGLFLLIALGLCALTILFSAIYRKTLRGVSVSLLFVVLGVLFALLRFTSLNISILWPLIPLSIFIPIAFAGLIVYKERFLSMIGGWGLVITTGLILTTAWTYIAGLVIVGVALMVAIIVKLLKREKKYEIPKISIVERAKQLRGDK